MKVFGHIVHWKVFFADGLVKSTSADISKVLLFLPVLKFKQTIMRLLKYA